MCLTCNPYCGRCKPPRKRRPVFCLDCGRENTFDDGDINRTVCSFCGGELPVLRTQPTVRCKYSGLLCSEPCGRAREKQADGVFKPCDRNVPPLDWKKFVKGLKTGPSETKARAAAQ